MRIFAKRLRPAGMPRFVQTLVFAGVALSGSTPSLGAQQQVPTDYVFIVDVSGSMVGKGEGTNIFPQVKQAINSFLGQIGPGSDVYIAPFEGHVRAIKRFQIQGSADITGARDYVNALVADGNSTAIYNSVNSVLGTVNGNRNAAGNDRTAVFFVYTDGNDNVSRDWTLQSFLENFRLKRGKRDWLFYTELGLPRNPGKEQTFSQFDRTRYIQESKGNVHPIVQIETLLPVLSFGNLKTHPKASRVERFASRGTRVTKTPISIRAEPVFPELRSQGVLAQLAPESFQPADSVTLHLSLTNAEALADGDYHGVVRLIPSDPLVLIVPSDIEVSFAYGADKEVSIAPGQAKSFPLDFGKIQVHGRALGPLAKTFSLRFSPTALGARKELRYTIEEDASNPAKLGNRLRLNSGANPLNGRIPAGASEATLQLVTDSALPPGDYKGKLRFEGEGLTVKGEGLVMDKDSAQTVEWRFGVARKPIPAWIWIALLAVILVAGALAARHFMKPPVFTDLKLDVLEPTRQTIDLAGRNVARFGAGQEFLQPSPATFSLKAKKVGRNEVALLELENGSMTLKKRGGKEASQILGDEEVYDGDVLQFGDFKLRVSSFSLVRE